VNFGDIIQKGGPAIWPLLFLSILSIGTIFERLWFWSKILKGERKTADQILEASRRDWDEATHLARQVTGQPMGRFLYTPLRLANKEPEIFRLALEASADEELNSMRRGHKVLEAVIAIAPLLGLLGTVLGLIESLAGLNIGLLSTVSRVVVPSIPHFPAHGERAGTNLQTVLAKISDKGKRYPLQ
jgi:biopolymer transport protein ExbB